jgi:terminase small subunit / prophage DNA-packing protein
VLAAREYLLGEPPRLASLAIGLDKPAVEKLLSETFATFLTRLAAWREVGDPDEDDTDKPDEDELA